MHLLKSLLLSLLIVFPLSINSSELEDTSLLAYIDSNIHCMAKTLYYEARGEGRIGMVAVAHVIVNRMAHPNYPSDACSVIAQPGQFSWFRKPTKIVDHGTFAQAFSVAWDVLSGQTKDPTNGAIMFHSTSVNPGWNRRPKAKIRNQIYY